MKEEKQLTQESITLNDEELELVSGGRVETSAIKPGMLVTGSIDYEDAKKSLFPLITDSDK